MPLCLALKPFAGSVFSRRRLPPREPRPHAMGANMLTPEGIPRGRRDAHEPPPSLPARCLFPNFAAARPASVAPLSCSSYAAAELTPSAAMLPNPCGGPALPAQRPLPSSAVAQWPAAVASAHRYCAVLAADVEPCAAAILPAGGGRQPSPSPGQPNRARPIWTVPSGPPNQSAPGGTRPPARCTRLGLL